MGYFLFSSIIAFMVLSIISSLLCLPLIVFACIGFADSRNGYGSNGTACFFFGIQILIALVQAVIAITTSAYSCRVVCSGKSLNPGQVLFSPSNAPPQIITNPIIRPTSPPSYHSNPGTAFPSSAEETPGN